MQGLLREIVIKEEEKFQLLRSGAFADVNSAVSAVSKKIDFSKTCGAADFKNEVLSVFYKKIDFSGFVQKQKNTQFDTPFFNAVYSLLRRKFLARGRDLTEWERSLGVEHPVAWCLKRDLFVSVRDSFSKSEENFDTAGAVLAFFENECARSLPISFLQFADKISAGDDFYLNALAEIVKKCAENVTKRKNFAFDESLVLSAIVEETYSLFMKRLNEGSLKFDTPAQLRTYIAKTCEFEFLEYCRNNKLEHKNAEYRDEIENYTNMPDEKDEAVKTGGFEFEVDPNNEYEVAQAIAMVILNPEHKLYNDLVKKDENKLKVLIDKSINNLSYSQIAEKIYGKVLGEKELDKKILALRKEYERFKQTLKIRYKEILSNKSINVQIYN